MLTEAKAGIMILLAEDIILADQIETEKKALLAQDSIVAKLSKEGYECSPIDSESGILAEEVEELRRKNEMLHQKSEELLKDIEERNRKIETTYHRTERMRRTVEILEKDILW